MTPYVDTQEINLRHGVERPTVIGNGQILCNNYFIGRNHDVKI